MNTLSTQIKQLNQRQKMRIFSADQLFNDLNTRIKAKIEQVDQHFTHWPNTKSGQRIVVALSHMIKPQPVTRLINHIKTGVYLNTCQFICSGHKRFLLNVDAFNLAVSAHKREVPNQQDFWNGFLLTLERGEVSHE